MSKILEVSRQKIVNADHDVSVCQQRIAEVRAQEPCGSRDHDAAISVREKRHAPVLALCLESSSVATFQFRRCPTYAHVQEAMLPHALRGIQISSVDHDRIPQKASKA